MRMLKRIVIGLCIVLVLVSCTPKPVELATEAPSESQTETQETSTTTEIPEATQVSAPDQAGWWTDAVFYEIFVRSFYDSDGDGVGDFQGIIEKLDYLNDGDPNTKGDLGITAIWLMPINPSPSYHGYDITNYFAVNPEYGTMTDFKQLLEEAHKRGIHVIMDFVINHTSSQNPWFVQAQDKTSGFHDWYVWSPEKPNVAGPWGQNAWYQAGNGLFYYAIFWSGMPDLNFKNAQVNQTIFNISRFWLDNVGVDGFRVDAARYLHGEFDLQQDTEDTLTWFRTWRQVVKDANPEAFTVGEVWTDVKTQSRYGGGTGLDSLFMFDLSDAILGNVFAPVPLGIMGAYEDAIYYFPDGQFSTFLTNHDTQRVMSFFGGNVTKAKVAAFIYLTGPGIPFVYYGEEIGMVGSKPDEYIRTPMQWSANELGGFSTTAPWEALNDNYEDFNVANQDGDPDSILNLYREVIALRNTHPALRTGSYLPLQSDCRQLYPVLRVGEDEILVTLVNVGRLSMEDCTLSIGSSPLSGEYSLQSIWGEAFSSTITFDANGAVSEFVLPIALEAGQMVVAELIKN